MPPLDATPGSRLEDEIRQLRAVWTNRSHADTVVELEKTVRGLRAAEAQVSAERRKVEDREREFQRLREVERVHRALSGERHFCNELSDVNTNLRRLVTRRGPDALEETVLQRLHDEAREKDNTIDTLHEEVAQLRRLQREMLGAAGEGQTGKLLAAQHHASFLGQQRDELADRNNRLQNDVLRVHEERIIQKRGSAANQAMRLTNSITDKSLTASLCLHCKPKAVVWQARLEDEQKLLKGQAADAFQRADELTAMLRERGGPQGQQGPTISYGLGGDGVGGAGGTGGQPLRAPQRPNGVLKLGANVVSPPSRSHPGTLEDSHIHLRMNPGTPTTGSTRFL